MSIKLSNYATMRISMIPESKVYSVYAFRDGEIIQTLFNGPIKRNQHLATLRIAFGDGTKFEGALSTRLIDPNFQYIDARELKFGSTVIGYEIKDGMPCIKSKRITNVENILQMKKMYYMTPVNEVDNYAIQQNENSGIFIYSPKVK